MEREYYNFQGKLENVLEKCNNIKKNKSYVPVHQGWKNGSHKGIESS